jgi:hypothetical protein
VDGLLCLFGAVIVHFFMKEARGPDPDQA